MTRWSQPAEDRGRTGVGWWGALGLLRSVPSSTLCSVHTGCPAPASHTCPASPGDRWALPRPALLELRGELSRPHAGGHCEACRTCLLPVRDQCPYGLRSGTFVRREGKLVLGTSSSPEADVLFVGCRGAAEHSVPVVGGQAMGARSVGSVTFGTRVPH